MNYEEKPDPSQDPDRENPEDAVEVERFLDSLSSQGSEPEESVIEREGWKEDRRGGLEEIFEGVEATWMNEAETRWTSVEEGNNRGFLYRILAEEFPMLGVRLGETHRSMGSSFPQRRVEVTPYKTNRILLRSIASSPVVEALTAKGKDPLAVGRRLEEEGRIPQGATQRALKREEQYWARYFTEQLGKYPEAAQQLETAEEKAKEFDVDPMTDEELGDLLRNAIQEEMRRQLS